MRNLDLFRGSDFLPSVRSWRPLLQEMDQLFNTFAAPATQQSWNNYNPNYELNETADHYVLSFDVPGIAKENLDIQVIGNQISIKGERKDAYKTKDTNGNTRESKRAFERTFTLPTDLKADAVEAHYEDGVLSLFVPKAEEAKPRKIQIGTTKEGFFKKLGKSESKDAVTN